jgi:hypothetical protein
VQVPVARVATARDRDVVSAGHLPDGLDDVRVARDGDDHVAVGGHAPRLAVGLVGEVNVPSCLPDQVGAFGSRVPPGLRVVVLTDGTQERDVVVDPAKASQEFGVGPHAGDERVVVEDDAHVDRVGDRRLVLIEPLSRGLSIAREHDHGAVGPGRLGPPTERDRLPRARSAGADDDWHVVPLGGVEHRLDDGLLFGGGVGFELRVAPVGYDDELAPFGAFVEELGVLPKAVDVALSASVYGHGWTVTKPSNRMRKCSRSIA